MLKADVAPGLTVTDDMYDIAVDGLTQHTPELPPLTWEEFTSPAWTLIPDENTGEAYKAERTLLKTPTRTIRINVWFAPDLRDSQGPKPHNHPWDFHSVILGGAYAEDRYRRNSTGGIDHHAGVEHRTGEVNKIGREEFHEVTAVDPGQTMTLMLCGPGMASWGYLDLRTGGVIPAVAPSGFMEQLRVLNPQQA
jgi:hypothetical protein